MSAATVPVFGVRLVREGRLPFPDGNRQTIRAPADAARFLQAFLEDRDRETFTVLLLNVRHEVLGVHVAHVGTLDAAHVHPREIFKAAILANAAAIILAHNHPSGDPEPSPDDTRITAKLEDAGKVLGIEVLDHVIVGDGRVVSLRERGHIR